MPLILDVETYKDYFLATFYNPKTGKYFETELHSDSELDIDRILYLMANKLIITFNGQKYDLPIIFLACNGASNATLKMASDRIIVGGKMWWEVANEFDFHIPRGNHIDIMNVLPGKASLKMYGARIHFPKLQELPIDPSASIRPEDRPGMRKYCRNDTRVTNALFAEVNKQISLRVGLSKQYQIDLRSKSDAQIAESVITSEWETKTGRSIPAARTKRAYKYVAPYFLTFESDELNNVLTDLENATFKIKRPEGSVITPNELLKKKINKKGETVYRGPRIVTIGDTKYALGIGGLHAKNKKESYVTNDDYQLFTIDANSYYPNVMINAKFYPPQMGEVFLDIYGDIVKTRLEAKARGDKVTADTLKIVVNSGYGKMGSKYSAFYAPDRLFHVTLTGQLCLLMLAEQIELHGVKVISANTDGLEVYAKHEDMDLVRRLVSEWEIETGLVMAYTNYKEIYYRDVNNYVAITEDGEMKAKGIFNLDALDKNPTSNVCIKAVKDYLMDGKDIEDSILECNTVSDFVTVRKVNGGAQKDGVPIGKAIRWYYSTETDTPIRYVKNGNKVPKSDGALPMMDLTEDIPPDINYQHYIDESHTMLRLMDA